MAALAAMTTKRATFPGWHPHPDVWALVLTVAVLYWVAVRHRFHTRNHLLLFGAGLATLLIASDWPVHDLAEHSLHSVHMVQHMLMSLVAPPLLIMGTPPWLARRIVRPILRPLRQAARPVPNLLQFNAILVLSHWPLIVNGTLEHHELHFVAHAVLVLSSLLMWLPVVSPIPEVPQLRPPGKMLYLFLQSIVPTVPASFLTFGSSPLYKFYTHVPRLYGISALTDQQIAGLIMKVIGGFYLWAVIGVIFFRWYAEEERDAGVLTWAQVEEELERLER